MNRQNGKDPFLIENQPEIILNVQKIPQLVANTDTNMCPQFSQMPNIQLFLFAFNAVFMAQLLHFVVDYSKNAEMSCYEQYGGNQGTLGKYGVFK